eukprot:UN09042
MYGQKYFKMPINTFDFLNSFFTLVLVQGCNGSISESMYRVSQTLPEKQNFKKGCSLTLVDFEITYCFEV